MTKLTIPNETVFLLLDDFQMIREAPKKELIKIGFQSIYEASNGKEGFTILERNYGTPNQIQFIISDLMMPEMTGLQLLEKVRKDERFSKLPFLALTTENESATVLKCIKLGVSSFLLKPFSSEDFIKKLDQCWFKHHS